MDKRETDGPYWCPRCEAIIFIDGEPATDQSEAWWHTYDHQDEGNQSVMVQETFERLDVVETEQHKIEGLGDSDG